jgi:hypothetical protein
MRTAAMPALAAALALAVAAAPRTAPAQAMQRERHNQAASRCEALHDFDARNACIAVMYAALNDDGAGVLAAVAPDGVRYRGRILTRRALASLLARRGGLRRLLEIAHDPTQPTPLALNVHPRERGGVVFDIYHWAGCYPVDALRIMRGRDGRWALSDIVRVQPGCH